MKIHGLFGLEIPKSPMQVMLNSAFKYGKEDVDYQIFNLSKEDFAIRLEQLKNADEVFCNITMPYKLYAYELLDRLDVSAKRAGAVNLINKVDGHLVGYNTEGQAVLQAILEDGRINPRDKKVLIIGAGGSAGAIGAALGEAGAESVRFINRTQKHAEDLVRRLTVATGREVYYACNYATPDLMKHVKNAHIVINATPVGAKETAKNMPLASHIRCLHAGQLVVDVVSRPVETAFLKSARRMGCKVLPGYLAIIYEGILSYEICTGKEAPALLMRQVVRKDLGL